MKRMKTIRGLLVAVVLASPVVLRAAIVDEASQFPPVVNPGQTLSVAGTFDTTKPAPAAKLYAIGSKDAKDAKDQKVISANQLAITLPDNLPTGRYYVKLTYNGATEQLPGELRVEANAVKVDAANPTTAYRNANGGFNFDIIGQNFNKDVPENNQVYISGRGPIIEDWSTDKQHCDESPKLPCLWVESSEKLHVVGYRAERYQGPLTFSVQVGSTRSAPEKKLTLSRMTETGVLILTIGIFLALAYIMYRLVARGMRDNVIDGEHYSPFWSFFLDKQTNSYSLSKFQLFSFFSVFVFGYLYVFLCSWLVQWRFVLPDVPSSFSGILALSAGTTLVAAGATAARGSKGSGLVTPSAADFITSGGQVIPERFQFFVWTLVACFGFVALLVSQDPATLEGFPSFPQGLLYVMGVSAGGYLGGKLTRPAGPVIRNIALDKTIPARPVVTIQGENLSKDADFFVDGKKLPIVPDETGLVTGTPQDQASDRSFCSELKIVIVDPAGVDLTTGDHEFRIMNKDGQFADIRLTANPLTITSVLDPTPLPIDSKGYPKVIAKGASEAKVIVKGLGYVAGMTARWTPANAKGPTELPASAVNFDPQSGEITLTLVPGDPGTGTLALLTPNGFSATASVNVV